MKNTILFLLLFGSLLATAQDTYTITVNLKGMQTDKGKLYVALYNTKKDFLKKNYKGMIVSVVNKKATAVFNEIVEGEYAISTFHDENNNKKMDTNFIGIPKEPIGISNDAKGFMGPPKYKKSKFLVNKNIDLIINVE